MNVVDLAILVILLIGVISGLARGFVRGIMGFVGLILGVLIAASNYQRLAPFLSFIPGARGPRIVSFLILFLVVLLLVGVVARLVSKALKLASLGWLDRLAGGVLGFVAASLVAGILLLIAVMAGYEGSPLLTRSGLAPRVLNVTDGVVRLLPADARATVQGLYGRLRTRWEKTRAEEPRLVVRLPDDRGESHA
jgi:membrane protein required for colicin V production